MVMAAPQFLQVAEAITGRTAELLGAKVTVVDRHGVVVASSCYEQVGHTYELASLEAETTYLRVPLRLDMQDGEVIVAQPGSGETVPPRLVQVLVDLIINQTIVVDRLPNQQELKNKFIHDLLRGNVDDEANVVREAQILGLDVTRPRAVILIDAADYILASEFGGRRASSAGPSNEARIHRRSQLVIASVVGFFNLPDDTICAYIGNGEVAVLKASGTQDLVAWTDSVEGSNGLSPSWANLTALKRASAALLSRLRRDAGGCISVGIGRYHPGVRGLARSYEDARAALSLGRSFHGHNQVHCLDSLGIAAFVGVSDERTKVDLARHLLSPLDAEPELQETLDVFFAHDCSASATAQQLSIHRNTLSYRLDKITSLTGLDPRRFDDAVQIRLALVLRSLRR